MFLMKEAHIPVLLDQFLSLFADKKINIFIDGTLGAGGHAEAMLEAHPEIERFYGIDQDPEALQMAEKRLNPWKNKLELRRGNFSQVLLQLLDECKGKVSGILLDIGVSSMQLDRPEKGFSFSQDGPLDMRMDPSSPLTAREIVNEWPEEEIARIFRDYGEEKRWRLAANTIVKARAEKEIVTTFDLVKALSPCLSWKKKGVNPLTLIFQGLRIAVNRELEVLEKALPVALDLLEPGGYLAVISFHSLEDRIVKNFFRFSADDKYSTSGFAGVFLDKEPVVRMVTKKPVVADDEDIKSNPRCRSARLRIVEKL